jgi:hypothetical protein
MSLNGKSGDEILYVHILNMDIKLNIAIAIFYLLTVTF